MLEHDNK
ncbi:hypothetical protein OXX59_009169, partial [Metschnikowia pulcherrima]